MPSCSSRWLMDCRKWWRFMSIKDLKATIVDKTRSKGRAYLRLWILNWAIWKTDKWCGGVREGRCELNKDIIHRMREENWCLNSRNCFAFETHFQGWGQKAANRFCFANVIRVAAAQPTKHIFLTWPPAILASVISRPSLCADFSSRLNFSLSNKRIKREKILLWVGRGERQKRTHDIRHTHTVCVCLCGFWTHTIGAMSWG